MRLFQLFLFIFFFQISGLQAQSNELKFALAKRSDDKGFVLRLILDQSLDSAKIIQPSADLIQIALYHPTIERKDELLFDDEDPIEIITPHPIENGLGIDISLKSNIYFIADIYPDMNKRDWLIGLTYAAKKELDILSQDINPINWEPSIIEDDSTQVDNSISQDSTQAVNDTTLPEGIDFDFESIIFDDNYNKIKDKSKFDVIVIDAGHGGKDPGTIGYRKSKEKDIALAVALKLGSYIEEYLPDVKVYYTRKDDRFIELEDRGHFANKVEGDLFISIHCNANNSTRPYGTEVYFLGQHRSDDALDVMTKENSVVRLEDNAEKFTEITPEQLLIYELTNSSYMAEAQNIAELIDLQFKNRVSRKSRGVKQAGFIVLYYASMPSILVELGFISNRNEERFLKSKRGQTLMASALFRAIRDYKVKLEGRQ